MQKCNDFTCNDKFLNCPRIDPDTVYLCEFNTIWQLNKSTCVCCICIVGKLKIEFYVRKQKQHTARVCFLSQLGHVFYGLSSSFFSEKVSLCLGAEVCCKLRNWICSDLLLVSDSWVLVQRGTERDKLVCECLQCLLFVLTVGTVDALESPRIITCEHLKSTKHTSVKKNYCLS